MQRGDRWFRRIEGEYGEFLEVWFNVLTRTLSTVKGSAATREPLITETFPSITKGISAWQQVVVRAREAGLEPVLPAGFELSATEELFNYFERRDSSFSPPLEVATVQALLDQKADPNTSTLVPGKPLCVAVRRGSTEVVRLLLGAGAELDAVVCNLTLSNHPGATPLILAILDKHSEIAELLKASGADLALNFQLAVDGGMNELRAMEVMNFRTAKRWSGVVQEMNGRWGRAIKQLLQWGADASLPDYQRLQEYMQPPARPTATGPAALASKAKLAEPNWAQQVKSALDGPDKNAVIEQVLAQSAVVRHPNWPDVIRHLIDRQPTFEDVAEEVYDERISREDDEGWLTQGFETSDYTDVPQLLTKVLARPGAVAHPKWEELLRRLIARCEEISFDPDNGLESLLEVLGEHPKAEWIRERLGLG